MFDYRLVYFLYRKVVKFSDIFGQAVIVLYLNGRKRVDSIAYCNMKFLGARAAGKSTGNEQVIAS